MHDRSIITSAGNPLIKRIRGLDDRKMRRREGAFLVEGLQPVWRAVECGWDIEHLIVAPDLLREGPAKTMASELEEQGMAVSHVSPGLFRRLSERQGPSGMMAIVRTREAALEDMTGPLIALHRAHNPGNIGTIIRTADAAGFGGVVLLEDCADPFAPTAVKASMGSLFAMPVVAMSDVESFLKWSRDGSYQVCAITGGGERDIREQTWSERTVLLLGNEGDGLPEDLVTRADASVRIPMAGTAESLNLAAAAAIAMYEVQRTRL